MKKKILVFIVMLCLSLFAYNKVQAGFIIDYGELSELPGSGEANWMAWWLTDGDGRPAEILTEDNTNSGDDEDIGYSELSVIFPTLDSDTNLEWIIQVENFATPPIPGVLDDVNMLFGGLGSFSGTLWQTTFDWTNTEAFTDHGIVASEEAFACPIIYDPALVEPNTYKFYGQPGTYLIYRSQNASGAGNGASNGRYFYFDTVTTTSTIGSFVDESTGSNWYIVFQVDETNTPIGCHSEPADPTGVSITDFSAQYSAEKTAIELAWQTASEVDVLGFNVLRSTSEVGAQVQINEEQVDVAHPGQMDGSRYTFDDNSVSIGQTYYYWIELIKTDSSGESVGPEAAFAGFRLFLPFVN